MINIFMYRQNGVPEVDRKPMAGGNYYQNIVGPLIKCSRQNMIVTHIHLSLTENEFCHVYLLLKLLVK